MRFIVMGMVRKESETGPHIQTLQASPLSNASSSA